jgi:hypothetical protein
MNVPAKPVTGEVIEAVIIKGDLRDLSPQERSAYYMRCCQSIGVNPYVQPFQYITLSGRLTLYATRTCTDQLRQIHGVSVRELSEERRDDGVYVVTCKVEDGKGRTDMAKGAVTIAGLRGDVLANALMKAETKAKRRATLSLCGLGWLDESEVEDIPPAARRGEPALNVALHEPDPPQSVTQERTVVEKAPAPAPLVTDTTVAGVGDTIDQPLPITMQAEDARKHLLFNSFYSVRSPHEQFEMARFYAARGTAEFKWFMKERTTPERKVLNQIWRSELEPLLQEAREREMRELEDFEP